MRGLKDFTDEECGHTDQAWERSEALVVMIGVGLNMASKMGPNVRCSLCIYYFKVKITGLSVGKVAQR